MGQTGIIPAQAMRQRAHKPVYLMRKYSAWEGRFGAPQLCTTSGFTVWPENPPLRGTPQHPLPVTLRTGAGRWVRGISMDADELRQVIESASIALPATT